MLTSMPFALVLVFGSQVNMIWQADAYSPLDFSLVDPHWGTVDDWRDLVDEIHRRNM